MTDATDIAIRVVDLIAVVCVPVLGWLHRSSRAATSDAKKIALGAEKDLAAFKVKVAEEYVSDRRLREMEGRLEDWLKRIESKLDKAHGVGD